MTAGLDLDQTATDLGIQEEPVPIAYLNADGPTLECRHIEDPCRHQSRLTSHQTSDLPVQRGACSQHKPTLALAACPDSLAL